MARIPASAVAVVAFHFLVAAAIAAIGGMERLAASRFPAGLLDSWVLEDKISHAPLLVQARDRLQRLQGGELMQ